MKTFCRSHILIGILLMVSCSDNVGGNLGNYTVPVEDISLNKSAKFILTNNEEKLFVTFSPADASNQSVFWTSSDDTVASVDHNGVVKGNTPGSVEIKAVSAEGNYEASCKVTVTAANTPISGVALNKTKLSIYASESETLFANVSPSNATGQTLDWESGDTSIAEVSDAGLVTAKSSGTTKVTVKTSDGKFTASCDVSVCPAENNPSNPVEVTGISVNTSSMTMSLGNTDCLVAAVLPLNAKNQNIIWISDNPGIVSVSSTGALKAEAAGYAVITVKSAEGSFSKQCEIFVKGSSTFTRTDSESSSVFITPGGVPYRMIVTPDLAGKKFPTGLYDYEYDRKPVPDSFMIAETEATYALWKEVYDWATDYSRGESRYIFSGEALNGADYHNTKNDHDYPATRITWRDAIVWCNALTEYYNEYSGSSEKIDCVYYSDPGFTTPLRVAYVSEYDKSINDKSGSFDKPFVKTCARGFRLPYETEWEFAARYIGPKLPANRNILDVDDIYYTKGSSASGAKSNITDENATLLVSVSCKDFPINASMVARVKTKLPNCLGLYDMSGNVDEYCFDWHYATSGARVVRGGSTLLSLNGLNSYAAGDDQCFCPFNKNEYNGFRIVRNK